MLVSWPHPHPQKRVWWTDDGQFVFAQSASGLLAALEGIHVDQAASSVHQTLFLWMRVWPHETNKKMGRGGGGGGEDLVPLQCKPRGRLV